MERNQILRRRLWIAAAIAIGGLHAADAGAQSYQVDSAKSRVTIHVDKTGAFSFVAGHRHEIVGPIESGSIDMDLTDPSRSHVRLVIAASNLKVSGQGEPAGDVPKVQAAMESDKVLDVARHPRITFDSTAVNVVSRRSDALDLRVAGQLTVRDVSQPITATVHVTITDTGLAVAGQFPLKQSAFGIKPISVGGAVSVKDTLDIGFSVTASK
jgi:polyisoprenoid-binding protein YceI